jgi:RNA polymerase sigma-70 factor (ECF subfamily)
MPGGDTELARRCQRGDAGAYAELVHRHRGMVYRVARAIMGCADDAHDVAQDALVRAYEAIGTYDGYHEFGAWLRRITVNRAVSKLRERRRAARLVAAGRSAAQPLPAADNPADSAAVRELEELLRRAIEELPLKQRLSITLFALEDMSLAETAEAIGCSVSAVKAHVHRARRKLTVLLSDYLQEA